MPALFTRISRLAKGLLRFDEQAINIGLLRNIGLNRDGFAASAGDFSDDLIRAGLLEA